MSLLRSLAGNATSGGGDVFTDDGDGVYQTSSVDQGYVAIIAKVIVYVLIGISLFVIIMRTVHEFHIHDIVVNVGVVFHPEYWEVEIDGYTYSILRNSFLNDMLLEQDFGKFHGKRRQEIFAFSIVSLSTLYLFFDIYISTYAPLVDVEQSAEMITFYVISAFVFLFLLLVYMLSKREAFKASIFYLHVFVSIIVLVFLSTIKNPVLWRSDARLLALLLPFLTCQSNVNTVHLFGLFIVNIILYIILSVYGSSGNNFVGVWYTVWDVVIMVVISVFLCHQNHGILMEQRKAYLHFKSLDEEESLQMFDDHEENHGGDENRSINERKPSLRESESEADLQIHDLSDCLKSLDKILHSDNLPKRHYTRLLLTIKALNKNLQKGSHFRRAGIIQKVEDDDWKLESAAWAQTLLEPKETETLKQDPYTNKSLLVPFVPTEKRVHESGSDLTILSERLEFLGLGNQNAHEISVLLNKVSWRGFPMLKFCDLMADSEGAAMALVGTSLFAVFDITEKFNLDSDKVFSFFYNLGKQYISKNLYHNEAHGVDVMQTISHYLTIPAVFNKMTYIEVAAALVAGAGHDVGHDGKNNNFHINTRSDLAVLYSDSSVLERMHAAKTFKMLYSEDCNWILGSGITDQSAVYMRQLVIDMILATDLKNSSEILGRCKVMIQARGGTIMAPQQQTARPRMSIVTKAMKRKQTSRKNINVAGSKDKKTDDEDDWMDISLLLQLIIKVSDVSHPTKPFKHHLEWSKQVTEEFYRQGDEERRLKLAISPLCDRGTVHVPKSQQGFINYVVKPCMTLFADFCKDPSLLEDLNNNLSIWARWGADEPWNDNWNDPRLRDANEQMNNRIFEAEDITTMGLSSLRGDDVITEEV
jgi:hypothetical protein